MDALPKFTILYKIKSINNYNYILYFRKSVVKVRFDLNKNDCKIISRPTSVNVNHPLEYNQQNSIEKSKPDSTDKTNNYEESNHSNIESNNSHLENDTSTPTYSKCTNSLSFFRNSNDLGKLRSSLVTYKNKDLTKKSRNTTAITKTNPINNTSLDNIVAYIDDDKTTESQHSTELIHSLSTASYKHISESPCRPLISESNNSPEESNHSMEQNLSSCLKQEGDNKSDSGSRRIRFILENEQTDL